MTHGDDEAMHVWIVEDNALLRDTVRELFDHRPGLQCTLAVESCEEALAALRRGLVPQVVLMDLGLPGMSGIEGIRRIRAISPASQVVVLTVHEDDDKVFEALCAGACGYLLKPATGQQIVRAVETALAGGVPMKLAEADRARARAQPAHGGHAPAEHLRQAARALAQRRGRGGAAGPVGLSGCGRRWRVAAAARRQRRWMA
jgi:DNA-binding NarL/FixJ family response regulator